MIIITTPDESKHSQDNEMLKGFELGLELETIIICDNQKQFETARRIADTLEVDLKKEFMVEGKLIIPIYSCPQV